MPLFSVCISFVSVALVQAMVLVCWVTARGKVVVPDQEHIEPAERAREHVTP